MDNNGLVFTIFSVLILSIGGLAQWSFLIMVRKCFWEVGPRAIDFMSLPVFLAIVGLIIAVANPMLNACLGSVPVPAANSRNPDQPSCSSDYSQDQRDKQLVIFILATVSIIWTAFCILDASDVVQSEYVVSSCATFISRNDVLVAIESRPTSCVFFLCFLVCRLTTHETGAQIPPRRLRFKLRVRRIELCPFSRNAVPIDIAIEPRPLSCSPCFLFLHSCLSTAHEMDQRRWEKNGASPPRRMPRSTKRVLSETI